MPLFRVKRVRRRFGKAVAVPRLSRAHRGWAVEALARGRAPGEVARALEEAGAPRGLVALELSSLLGHEAWLEAATAMARGLMQIELLLEVQRRAAGLGSRGIERRPTIAADDFFEQHYAPLIPLVLTEVVSKWPAMERWQLATLENRFAGVEVEICEGRESDPDYDMNFADHAKRTTLKAFLERIQASEGSNDCYMVANNRNLWRTELAALVEDVVLPEFMDPDRLDGWCSLWIGPRGTKTPLHHDLNSILFCQVVGRKKIWLAPPHERALLEGMRGVYSAMDLSNAPEVNVKKVELEPGEALFIPIGWWHQVEALDPSVSISFLNFRRDNAWPWYVPGRYA